MKSSLLQKLKEVVDATENPNSTNINIQLTYNELVHLYALEVGDNAFKNALETEIHNAFKKVE